MTHRRFLLALIATGLPPGMAICEEVKVSHCFQGDIVAAINDPVEPTGPRHQPRHSF